MIMEKGVESIGSFLIVVLSSVIFSVFLFAQNSIHSCMSNRRLLSVKVDQAVKLQQETSLTGNESFSIPILVEEDPSLNKKNKAGGKNKAGDATAPTTKPVKANPSKLEIQEGYKLKGIYRRQKPMGYGLQKRRLTRSDVRLILSKLDETMIQVEKLEKEVDRVCSGPDCKSQKTKHKIKVFLKALKKERAYLRGKGL